ncbi:MAG: phosphotransferase, partial [Candidatus Cryptobacteroides sp.]
MKELLEIAGLFQVQGWIEEIKPLGNGLINDTYKVVTSEGAPDYVLQRINNAIFQDVELLQNNICAVTSHIRRKLEAAREKDIDRKVLNFIPAKEGGRTYVEQDGKFWRMSVFIDNADTFESVTPEYSEYAGEAFGDFEAKLADIDVELGETIPDFHNMELRLRQLVDAVSKDASGRLHKEGKEELEAILSDIDANAEDMCLAEQLHRQGRLPKRI